MEIAVFGGSFSPVHIGHMAVASTILERKLADEVWMMPCRLNPLKTENELWSDEDRLALLEKAAEYRNGISGKKNIRISRHELSLPSPSYTVTTFKSLMAKYPEAGFRLVAGADSYLDFTRWRDWEWIEENCRPIVYPRPGFPINNLRPGWTLLEGVTLHDVSSSDIRKMLESGKVDGDLMPWLGDRLPNI